MKDLNAFHLVLGMLAWAVHKRRAKRPAAAAAVQKPVDVARSALEPYWPLQGQKMLTYLPYVLAFLPVYVGYGNPSFPKLFEHALILAVYFVAVRTFQRLNNPTASPGYTPNWSTHVTTSLLLLYVQSGIVSRDNLRFVYAWILMQTIAVVFANPVAHTGSSVLDDVVLSHLIFYVNKF